MKWPEQISREDMLMRLKEYQLMGYSLYVVDRQRWKALDIVAGVRFKALLIKVCYGCGAIYHPKGQDQYKLSYSVDENEVA